MSLATELETPTSLTDRGELTQAEFEKAKERLLSEHVTGASQATEARPSPPPLEGKGTGPKQLLLIAILSTIAVVFSWISAVLNSSPISSLALALFTVASTLNWIEFSKRRAVES